MPDLERYIEDLIAAADMPDADADDLRAVMADVRARRDAKLRGDVQRTVGQTHLSIREQMDRIISLQIDTRGLVADAAGQLDTLEAAAVDLRRGFQAVGETINGIADDVALLKAAGITQEQHNRRIEQQLEHHAHRIGSIEEELSTFRQSRDASIAERRQHAAMLRESADDRAHLTARMSELSALVERLLAHERGA